MSTTPGETDALVSELGRNEGVVSIHVNRGASVKAEGDVVTLLVTNAHLFEVMRAIERIVPPHPSSFTLSEPAAAYSRAEQARLDNDIVESIWEESETLLQKTSRISHNFILLMIFAGSLAAIGLATNTLHLVIAAMLVVPGFQPIVNIPLGLVLGKPPWIRRGVVSTLWGYGVFTLAAVLMFHALLLAGTTTRDAFPGQPLVSYWTTFSATSVLVPLIAAAAGIVIIPTHRSVLTAGVMVALALVPGAAIFGICLANGQYDLALRGLEQWGINVGSVLVTGVLIFWLKMVLVHKRSSWH